MVCVLITFIMFIGSTRKKSGIGSTHKKSGSVGEKHKKEQGAKKKKGSKEEIRREQVLKNVKGTGSKDAPLQSINNQYKF